MSDRTKLLEAMIKHGDFLAKMREENGFVWTGDMEKDPRYIDFDQRCEQPGRVAWGRDREDRLFELDEASNTWIQTSDDEWIQKYPRAGLPPHLPRPSS